MFTQEETKTLIKEIVDKTERDKRVRRRLPGGGKISIDKAVPYLIIYRNIEKDKEPEIMKLVLSEASYLVMPADKEHLHFYRYLINELVHSGMEAFGSFLLLEVWEGKKGSNTFTIKCPDGPAHSTVETLLEELKGLRGLLQEAKVEAKKSLERHPPGFEPVAEVMQIKELGGLLLGLEIPTVFQNPQTGNLYPVFFRKLRERMSEVLRKTLYDFVRVQTTSDISSYRMLGRRSMDNAVRHIDKKLAEIEKTYQFLLLVSPVNGDQEWEVFKKNKFKELPEFTYRLLPIDPELVKRELYNLNMNKINDPALAYLFRDKRNEIDMQVSMLAERGTKNFMYNSIRLYKGIDSDLHNLALGLLSTVPPGESEEGGHDPVSSEEFAARAKEEFNYYRSQYSGFDTRIEIRDDITGLMVSQGNLYIPHNKSVRRSRVEALIHHEVGTHVLTYCNGKAQPLQQLCHGLADYDELQEGLAVLAEYLVDGLDRSRMRLLAARVVAAHSLTEGADFIQTFNLLLDHKMDEYESWYITTRIYQCGGFIKDIIYLRGLVRLIEHLRAGGELDTLYIGKIADKHIPLINELREREILLEAPLVPRYLHTEQARERLQRIRDGLMLPNLITF